MKILRWITVFPASLLALILGYFIIKITMVFSGIKYDSIFSQMFIGLVSGVVFIYAGVSVAPSHKVKTALILMIIAIVLTVVNLYIINFVYKDYLANVREIFAIIGVVIYFFEVKKNEIH